MQHISRMLILLSAGILFFCIPSITAAADDGSAETAENSTERDSFVYELCLGLNFHDLDSFWSQAYQWGVQPGLKISDSWYISIPVQFMIHGDKDVWMIDTGCRITCYPGLDSWWLGLTLLQNLLIYGEDAPDDNHFAMSELVFGKTIALGSSLTFDPYLLLRNPFGKHNETLVSIQENFPSFGQLEIGLGIGIELFN